MQKIKRTFLLLLALVFSVLSTPLVFFPSKAKADTLGAITRHSVTFNTKARGITTGSDGNLWYAGYGINKIGKITPAGVKTEYNLPNGFTAPEVITNGPSGSIWFSATGGANGYSLIEMKTDGTIEDTIELPVPTDRNSSGKSYLPNDYFRPHSIAVMDGYVWIDRWFSRYLQRVSPSGSVDQIRISTPKEPVPNNTIYTYSTQQVVFNPHTNSIWVGTSYNGSNPSNHLEEIKADGSRALHTFPTGHDAYRGMAVDGAGKIWFTGTGSTDIGYMNPSGSFSFIDTADADGDPMAVTLGSDGNIWATSPNPTPNSSFGKKILKVDVNTETVTPYALTGMQPTREYANTITAGPDGNVWFTENNSHHVSKIGAGVTTAPDEDADGLTQYQELQQGTSDLTDDTDRDGLSDMTESQWFTDRDEAFCNSTTSYCEYPAPMQRDLYVEVDWMDNTIASTQPTSSQVASVEILLAAKNIRPHFDTGNLGGGNQVPYFTNVAFGPDPNDNSEFYDFKNGNSLLSEQFDSDARYGIWRYMLFVPHIYTGNTIQGISYAGDDDSMIAYASLQANHSSNFDDAVANTMLHELGHNLCLTDDDPNHVYAGQHPACVFEGVDDSYATSYESSMNYNFQYLIKYSDGAHGVNDHDDWAGVGLGFDDFTTQEVGDTVAHSRFGNKKVKKDPGKILKDYRKSNKKNLLPNDYRKPIIN